MACKKKKKKKKKNKKKKKKKNIWPFFGYTWWIFTRFKIRACSAMYMKWEVGIDF